MDGEGYQVGSDNISTDVGERQRADEETVFPNVPLGTAWGESITTGRAAELEARLQAWEQEAEHGERQGPFDVSALPSTSEERDSQRLTGAEVFWLAGRTLVDTSDVPSVAAAAGRLRQAPDDPEVRLDLNLSALNLSGADLQGADLSGADLEGANLSGTTLGDAHLSRASLWSANLSHAIVEFADLSGARLEGADLSGADLEGANLSGASLWSANLSGATLTRATFDNRTSLLGVHLTDTPHGYSALLRRLRRERIEGPVSLADLHWNEVDLTVVDWSGLRRLGDERGPYGPQGTQGTQGWRRWWRSRAASEQATRANTQLATRLRDAGMNDDADRFAYRAQVCQRGVHLLRGRILRWLFSWLLFVIAGYGYRPLRTVFWYLAVIFAFAAIYFSVGPGVGVPLSPLGSLVFSITSFHGRGFFPGGSPGHSVTLDDPLTVMAAMEAVVGLFIEISFIATFTQRYFGK